MSAVDDRFDLNRFVSAQTPAWPEAVAELKAGRRRTNWVCIVFPPYAGAGSGVLAQRFSIRSMEEADAFLVHELLGARLVEAAGLAAAIPHHPRRAFGWREANNLRASMTLFAGIAPEPAAYRAVLENLFEGRGDPRTEQLVRSRVPNVSGQ